jgi:hypothetical protein
MRLLEAASRNFKVGMNLLVEMVVHVLQICHAAHVRVFQKGHQLLAVVVEGPGKRNLEIQLQKNPAKNKPVLGIYDI